MHTVEVSNSFLCYAVGVSSSRVAALSPVSKRFLNKPPDPMAAELRDLLIEGLC